MQQLMKQIKEFVDKEVKQTIHKWFNVQKKAARTAISCLMLLLLYGCTFVRDDTPAVAVVSKDDSDLQSATEEKADEESQNAETQENVSHTASAPSTEMSETKITVFVCGAVQHPGVYELSEGSRVYEAVACAGGMTKEASQTSINQAELLTDAQMIVIPTKEEADRQAQEAMEKSDGLVNINTADVEELEELPGIGASKARSIVAYRETHGAFASIDELKNIEGIKDGVFAQLEGCIKVE